MSEIIVIKIQRRLHGIRFFYQSTELQFDGIKISVAPEDAIGQAYNPKEDTLYEICFEETTENYGNDVVIVTAEKTITENHFNPFLYNKKGENGEKWQREV